MDETLARRTWPGQRAVGKKLNVTFIHNGSFDSTRAEVVGVARHVHYQDLTTEVRGQVYVPYLQSARWELGFALRGRGDPALLVGPVREAVRALDPDLAVSRIALLFDAVGQARTVPRFTTVVAAALAGLALLLACVGIYGVLSYSVAQRTQDIGLRMALGGRSRDILRLVGGQAARLVASGLAAGLLASLVVTGLLTRLLYGVGPHDAVTILASALLIASAAALAAWVPVARAMRVDPMVALRCD